MTWDVSAIKFEVVGAVKDSGRLVFVVTVSCVVFILIVSG